jgi:hypothetical protein
MMVSRPVQTKIGVVAAASLAGEAVVAIWTGIDPEVRDQAYDWYINEHSLERVGISGFRRGRRCIAAGPATSPEFFTLYEADSMQVLQGSDYANRLNNPTPATKFVSLRWRCSRCGAAAQFVCTDSDALHVQP